MKQAKAQWGRYPLGYPWRVAGTKSRASNIPCRSKGRSSSGNSKQVTERSPLGIREQQKVENSRYKGSVWHHSKIMKNRRCSPQIASSCIIVAFCYIIYPQPKISNTFGAKRPARPNIDGHDPPKPSHLRRRSLEFPQPVEHQIPDPWCENMWKPKVCHREHLLTITEVAQFRKDQK